MIDAHGCRKTIRLTFLAGERLSAALVKLAL